MGIFNVLSDLIRREQEPDESLWSPCGWSMATGGDPRSMSPVHPVGRRKAVSAPVGAPAGSKAA